MLYSKYPHNENARKKKEKTKKKGSIALASGNKLCAAEREATTQNVVCVCVNLRKMLRKKKKYPWPYLEFLASCSVAEHHPQGTTGIEPRYGALTASQVHWLHSSMWLSLLLWLMFIFARWVQTLQTAKRNISKKKIFIFRYLLNNKTIHQLPAVPALFQIMQSLLLLSSHVPLVKKIRGDQNRTWLDLNHPPQKNISTWSENVLRRAHVRTQALNQHWHKKVKTSSLFVDQKWKR